MSQLLFISFVEIIFYTICGWIIFLWLGARDIGGSIGIHGFGAIFGLAASWVMNCCKPSAEHNEVDNCSCYHFDLFSMIGTFLLFIYWPSFNCITALDEVGQYQAIMNTILSMIGAVVSGFFFSRLLRPESKFSMVDIHNATLAGGVIMGSCADLITHPAVALSFGLVAGMISVVMFTKILPWQERRLGVLDTCGISGLHCVPGVLGGLASIAVVAIRHDGGEEPWLAALDNAAGNQAAACFLTWVIALGAGLATGLLARLFVPALKKEFDDGQEWVVPSDY